MINDSIHSYINEDVQLAYKMAQMDDEVDQLHSQILRELFTYIMEAAKHVESSTAALFRQQVFGACGSSRNEYRRERRISCTRQASRSQYVNILKCVIPTPHFGRYPEVGCLLFIEENPLAL